jgi:hypothetical protein
MSIYQDLKAAGVQLDHHESDLYAKVTPESQAIVDGYRFKCNVTRFTSQIDGLRWYDIPFAYEPFWDAVKRRADVTVSQPLSENAAQGNNAVTDKAEEL